MTSAFRNILREEHLHFKKERVCILTALYGIACGNSPTDRHLKVAKSLELMKSSTLIIDDFLDRADTRSGVPSLYAAEGPERAVLVGETLRSTALIELCRALDNEDGRTIAAAICLFEDTFRAICLGQMEDMQLELAVLTHDRPTEADYFQMITHSTARFIQLPLLLGGLLARRPDETVHALGIYGLKIGLAYQVRDDVLDIVASPELTGKPRAGDIRNRKKRLPILRLRDSCSDGERKRLVSAFNGKGTMNETSVQQVIERMEQHGAVESCKHTTTNLCAEALAAVRGKVFEEELAQLETIAGFLTDFTYLTEARHQETASAPG